MTIIYTLVATLVISLISLVGAFTLSIKEDLLKRIVFILVAFSAGSLMGGAFFHLIPESLEMANFNSIFVYVLVGFSLFFIIERVLHWHHCHEGGGECEVHTFTYMNLIGDAFHNFLDGLVIAASFSLDTSVGLATTIAVISHEIPQEMSDFGVLIYGGLSKGRALLYNFLSALTAILGAIIGLIFANINNFQMVLLPFIAGGFIYIAASDLIPELHKESKLRKSLLSFLFFVLGIGIMYVMKNVLSS